MALLATGEIEMGLSGVNERWGLVTLLLWTPVALLALALGIYLLYHFIFGK